MSNQYANAMLYLALAIFLYNLFHRTSVVTKRNFLSHLLVNSLLLVLVMFYRLSLSFPIEEDVTWGLGVITILSLVVNLPLLYFSLYRYCRRGQKNS